MYFTNYRLQNVCLLKCLKNPVSKHLSTVVMLKCPKDCSFLRGSIFLILFDQFERNSL